MKYILVILGLLYFFCISSAFQISYDSPNNFGNSLAREKRQLEDLDADEFSSGLTKDAQEEPSFWDRVVKVALRLFNKFIEWLNT
ncbi:uncharacterized protein LOC123692857 [Colias croceus]|uniref:uncharacterized protein LOC123692857 n=1 Tax=Colias crocea TaxID=72248 RepID=UPI001E281443|nr:uncharacterized protein LOC123692857 [Colias croceus]